LKYEDDDYKREKVLGRLTDVPGILVGTAEKSSRAISEVMLVYCFIVNWRVNEYS
jgi:hypothetical protein